MSWIVTGIVGGSLITGLLANEAADSASDAQIQGANIAADASAEAAQIATDESRRQFNLIRKDTEPYRIAGVEALNLLRELSGTAGNAQVGRGYDTESANPLRRAFARAYNGDSVQFAGSGGGASPNYNAFFASPSYRFNLAEGQKALDRSLVARTGGLGGRGVKEGVRYASGMASNEFANFWNRVAAQAGIGQTAVAQSGSAGTTSAGQVGNAMLSAGNMRGNAAMAAGNAAANADITRGAAWNNAIQGGIQNYMLYDYLRPAAPAAGRASMINSWRSR